MPSHVSALLVRRCFSFKFTFSLLFLIAFSYSSCPFITVLNVAREMADHFKAASPDRCVLEGCVTYIALIDLLVVFTGINLCCLLRYYMCEYVSACFTYTSTVFIPTRTDYRLTPLTSYSFVCFRIFCEVPFYACSAVCVQRSFICYLLLQNPYNAKPTFLSQVFNKRAVHF